MRIATLTYQRHDNVGAMLQCYALQQTIEKMGHKNEIIDYICDAADHIFGYESYKNKGIIKYITSCIGYISRIPKMPAFYKFRKDYLKMTHKVDKRDVASLDGIYDGYIVGSDNVWNSQLTALDENYFLSFVSDDRKKTSYAASLGLANVPVKERKKFSEHLAHFSIITTRERTSAEDLSKLLGRTVVDTCDPTILLGREEWNKLLIESCETNYILAYQMTPSLSFVKFVKDFARNKGLKVVYIPFPYGFCKCDIKPHIGPRQWLGYIKNAEYVVTDSFHGCVFSAIYEKNLIIKISQLGARINNLAEILGLRDRIVETVDQAIELPAIDYTNIRLKLTRYRKNGLANLSHNLTSFEDCRGNKI